MSPDVDAAKAAAVGSMGVEQQQPPQAGGGQATENSPIPQVAMTVPLTDDPSLPVMTFRMWVLGTLSCVLLSFLNQFFFYRSQPLSISSISAQIAVVPLGHLMARTLPRRKFLEGTPLEFTLNPGPFNVKEHVLITIFANSGAGGVYAMHIVTSVKAFYHKKISFFVSFLIMLTTQTLGFGWAGIFRRYLVQPAEMWWPSNLIQVSLFGALHEKDRRPKGSLTRNQFFLIAFLCSFAYYIFPGYIMTMLTSISWLCWVFPKSVLAQQLGSGLHGLGIGTVAIDWATMTSYLGSPLASPWFATANVLAGFVLVMYVVVPASYWMDVYKAKTFPIYSARLFNTTGAEYDIASIIGPNFKIDYGSYEQHGRLYLSTFFAMTYGLGFATLTATLSHVLLFHGEDIARMTKSAIRKGAKIDIHTRLMARYKQVPEWWFMCMLVVTVAISLLSVHVYKDELQLPMWGVLLACLIALFFTLPIGVITATTNQQPGLNVITEYIIGYMYPGRPVANVLFKTYGYISMTQALTFLSDFKLGHYMKIPPRTMFIAQVVGTVVAALVYLATGWWLLESVPDICDPSNNHWNCPYDQTFYDASVIWGLIGPRRIFGNMGTYNNVNWFFLGGAFAPALVYAAHKMFPKQKWIRLINLPVLLGATAMMPPASAVNYTTWILAAFISGYVVLKHYPAWWERHNYVLSGAMDAGVAFNGVLVYFTLGMKNIMLNWWGNFPDSQMCPVAHCPTAPGVVVDGCPVY